MLSLSACIRQTRLGEVGRLLWLGGIVGKPENSTDTQREAFRGVGLLSSYRLIDFGDVVPWSFNTRITNLLFKTHALKCSGKEGLREK